MPGDPFRETAFSVTPGKLENVWLDIPGDASWLQWYVTASDDRGWTTRVPFADTMYYQIGDIATALGETPAPAGMHLALYPQPRQQDRDVMLEWRTPGREQATFVLTDLLGRTVLSRDLPASGSRLRTTRITLPRLAVGVYIGVLRTGELIQVTKVTVR